MLAVAILDIELALRELDTQKRHHANATSATNCGHFSRHDCRADNVQHSQHCGEVMHTTQLIETRGSYTRYDVLLELAYDVLLSVVCDCILCDCDVSELTCSRGTCEKCELQLAK